MKLHKFWAAVGTALAVLAPAITVIAAPSAQAQSYSVLYTFHGKHGENPYAGLIQDKKGNLYGTTEYGGAYGYGVVFKLHANGKEKVLHSFTGGADGGWPVGGLVRDSAGNLYGTTPSGGAYNCGVVFKLDTTGAETVLHSFTGGTDGAYPLAGLVRDFAGNLYGTAAAGTTYGWGVVFKLGTTGVETVLYTFSGGTDGGGPVAGLVRAAGNLYGTTEFGGAYGDGVVFKLNANGKEKVLHSFAGGGDGSQPYAGLVRDSAGNLYGTTSAGGAYLCGVVFELDTTGAETVLHAFASWDGCNPYAGLVRDPAGHLYGTTSAGGAYGGGVVFSSYPFEPPMYSFTGGADGSDPHAGLVRDPAGHLYGTTSTGGDLPCGYQGEGCGVVFKITPL